MEDNQGIGQEEDEDGSVCGIFPGIHVDYQELSTKKQRLFKRKCLDLLHELLDQEDAERAGAYQSDAMNLSSSSHVSDDEREQKYCVDKPALPSPFTEPGL